MTFRKRTSAEVSGPAGRLYDDHVKLDLRWSDAQLQPVVDLLKPLLPSFSVQKQLAIASLARSIYVAGKGGVHFSRAKNVYASRYTKGRDKYQSYRNMTDGADALVAAGLIDQIIGGKGAGRETTVYATGLVHLLSGVVDPEEPRALAPQEEETIILRDRNGKNLDYHDDVETQAMRAQLTVFNHALTGLDVRHYGQRVHTPLIRRIFNQSFERGGRMYCHGPSYQVLSKSKRSELEFVLDGQAHPVVELDFVSLHINLAYAEAGKRPPKGDLYAIDGFERSLVKLAVNILFNAASKSAAINAIAYEGYDHHLAKEVVKAVRRKHSRIRDFFGSECGLLFMRRDSDLAVEIMSRMLSITGRCPLPLHDSFLVAQVDQGTLRRVMEEASEEYGRRKHDVILMIRLSALR
ncbi:hypothetical protein A5657_03370 [Mycobacterium kubicae]|nr:hypothetical protein A5657_03370 [Mycobacterium kubicae]